MHGECTHKKCQQIAHITLCSEEAARVQPRSIIHFLGARSVQCAPQTPVASPWDARGNASTFACGIQGAQDRRRCLVLEARDADRDDVAAQLHPPLNPIDEDEKKSMGSEEIYGV